MVVEQPVNGIMTFNPALPADGNYPEGTVITVTTKPNPGFALDAGYFTISTKKGMYFEFFTPEFKVTIDQDKKIGASFIETSKLKGFKVTHDVVYAKPGVKPLKYDVFSPDGAKDLPCIIIIHGGGWRTNRYIWG